MTTHQPFAVLTKRPLALVFDIDGTLSPIAPTPDAARLYPGVTDLLKQARQYAHVAIMTGRAVADGAAMVNVEGLTYIGTHGLEWCDGLPTTHTVHLIPEATAYIDPANRLLDLAEQQLSDIPGLIVQRKQVGGTVHYRLAPDAEQARTRIIALLEEPARQTHLRLSEGKRMVEVLAPLNINKGEALRRYVAHVQAQGVVFAGDDRTDMDAVIETAHLRAQGIEGLAIVVQHEDTLPDLLEHADLVVEEVPGMVQLLRTIVTQLAAH